MGQTRLSRSLAERPQERPDAAVAFRVAQRAFLAGDRLEMQDLAAEIGVSRATLFRWVGPKEQLLVEIFWSLAVPTFEQAVTSAGGTRGPQRIAKVLSAIAGASVRSAPFMAFVQREPKQALRLLCTRAGTFQDRLLGLIEPLLQEEIEAGRVSPPLPLHDLAYLILRVTETFVYADAIAGATPDPAKVGQAIRALLRD
ncbi:QsdR family transcriptional regulator [Dermatophilaceae bacterium Soc4.6]